MQKKYSDYIEISPTFESVVDIDSDTRNKNLWREYSKRLTTHRIPPDQIS